MSLEIDPFKNIKLSQVWVETKSRLMIVDDEVFNIFALKGLMRVLGCEMEERIDVCYNGEQAVDLIRKAIREGDVDRYSLILTDCSMPFMDGYEASKLIRLLIKEARNEEEVDKLKIVAITGHVEPEYILKAHRSGINKVFPKPVPILELGTILCDLKFIQSIPTRLQRQNTE